MSPQPSSRSIPLLLGLALAGLLLGILVMGDVDTGPQVGEARRDARPEAAPAAAPQLAHMPDVTTEPTPAPTPVPRPPRVPAPVITDAPLPPTAASIESILATETEAMSSCMSILQATGLDTRGMVVSGRFTRDPDAPDTSYLERFGAQMEDGSAVDPGLSGCFRHAIEGYTFQATASESMSFQTGLDDIRPW